MKRNQPSSPETPPHKRLHLASSQTRIRTAKKEINFTRNPTWHPPQVAPPENLMCSQSPSPAHTPQKRFQAPAAATDLQSPMNFRKEDNFNPGPGWLSTEIVPPEYIRKLNIQKSPESAEQKRRRVGSPEPGAMTVRKARPAKKKLYIKKEPGPDSPKTGLQEPSSQPSSPAHAPARPETDPGIPTTRTQPSREINLYSPYTAPPVFTLPHKKASSPNHPPQFGRPWTPRYHGYRTLGTRESPTSLVSPPASPALCQLNSPIFTQGASATGESPVLDIQMLPGQTCGSCRVSDVGVSAHNQLVSNALAPLSPSWKIRESGADDDFFIMLKICADESQGENGMSIFVRDAKKRTIKLDLGDGGDEYGSTDDDGDDGDDNGDYKDAGDDGHYLDDDFWL